MAVKWVAGLAMLVLGGCSSLPDWRLFDSAGTQTSTDQAADNFDFAWRLSGDPEVAPLQVFDNGRRMWLQFVPGQAVPAIFASTSQGERLLGYRREDPYVVLDQVWPHLLLRGGQQLSYVDRLEVASVPSRAQAGVVPQVGATDPSVAMPETFNAGVNATPAKAVANDPVGPVAVTTPLPGQPANASLATSGLAVKSNFQAQPLAVLDMSASVSGFEASRPAAQQTHTSADLSHAAPDVTLFDVSPQDRNMRLALSRWAGMAGWTFEAEHWSVDADIPIAGSAQFRSGFKQAVQALMAATELADRPLQPCFYSNKVLRIVPYAQPCNRVASLSGAS